MEVNIGPCWRKASYSGNGGGDCVEVGNAARVVLVRDTVNRDGAVIEFTPDAWRTFATAIKHIEAG